MGSDGQPVVKKRVGFSIKMDMCKEETIVILHRLTCERAVHIVFREREKRTVCTITDKILKRTFNGSSKWNPQDPYNQAEGRKYAFERAAGRWIDARTRMVDELGRMARDILKQTKGVIEEYQKREEGGMLRSYEELPKDPQ